MRKIKFDLLCKKTRCPNFALFKVTPKNIVWCVCFLVESKISGKVRNIFLLGKIDGLKNFP